MADGDLSASLTLRRGALARVGLDRVAMVEAVAELGSISAAAKKLGLSYKGAWDVVQALNNLFDTPLIEAAPGGRAGGTAIVTLRGQAVVTAFRRVQQELDAALAKLDASLNGQPATDLFWSLGMRTSARNALRGVVSNVTPGAVNGEVTLTLADGVEITAILTRRSIEDLGLEIGKPAIALIKAGFVILAKGENLRTSARNQIAGHVSHREDGAVNSEITLDIGGGKTLVAGITLESAQALELTVGDAVTALVKAPHVILAVE
ncbi:MAG: TOBE domain-containing protein [Alphaproteobacteria bacterium]|nr:TOBE domain-containing protein [Alphaproteobacteria bacterium]MBU1512990.1 TOBE domain-containing protein [Alphaproteobacteria bacterium]MBU2095098.1 TOBE domain-containing protein [Alphaproteobacteria bacterium]MBU2153031.1 TOBE domain-containing protein [Alphaproteobacteria bacterium]MBU2306349.1 TOBE domain-containing protein [Alphaproteobacteria bacterium]